MLRRPSRLLVVGLAVVVAAVVVGLVLVQRVGTTYRDGLDVAADSAGLAVDAAEPIESITADLVTFARAAEAGIGEARTVVASAQVSLDQLGAAAEDELAGTTEGLASLADRVAGVIESIERFIPGDRSSAAEDLRQIADGLEPVPGELRSLGAQLQDTAAQLAAADTTLADLETTVADLGDDLAALAPAVGQLTATAELLADRVADARSRVGIDLWLARVGVILGGAVLAIALLLIESRPRPPEVFAPRGVSLPGAGTNEPGGAKPSGP